MGGPTHSLPPVPPLSSATDRLDSWKEIASYLKRSVRTVRRWENEEALPVHRHFHQSSRTVYAFKQEVDAWWASRGADLESRAESVQRWAGASERRWKRTAIAGGLFLIAMFALAAVLVRWRATRLGAASSVPGSRVMLAVLPFDNLSPDSGQEYFSDGLTEETITELGHLNSSRMGVIARTSVMRYRKTQESVDQIGRELHVYYILEGSVRHEADRVRVTAQLIRVNDQTHVWAASYDRNVSGVLSLQGEIAQAIARAIEIKLSPEQEMRLASVYPVNGKAHEAYLRGRYLWSTHTEEGLNRSIEYFQQAIAIDPNYAQAYAGLAASYGVLGVSYLPAREMFPKARAADTKALEIDPTLAYGYVGLGAYKLFYEWDWPGAETALKRAIELDPNDAEAHELYASYLEAVGQLPEAVKEMRKAHELDPLSLSANVDLGNAYYYAREFDQAIEQYRRTLEISSESGVYQHLGLAYVQKHRYGEAIAALEKGITVSGGSTAAIARLGYALGMAGKRKEALQQLDRLNHLGKKRYAFPEDVALAYISLGDKDHAFEQLQKAVDDHSWVIFLKADPAYETLRNDPRFDQLMQRIVQSRESGIASSH